MVPLNKCLKEILLRDNLVSASDIDRALNEQKSFGGELSNVLLKLKLISEDVLSVALSEALKIPIINLSLFKIDPELVKLVPKSVALSYQLIPLSKIGDQLTIAIVDPMNVVAIDNVRAVSGLSINVVMARTKDIKLTIDKFYSAGEDAKDNLEEILKDIKESEDLELVKEGAGPSDKREVESLFHEAPIITLTNTIIQQAIIAKASDIFIEPMQNSLRIRYRIDGFLREADHLAKALHFSIISRIKVISNLDIAEHRLPQDGRFRSIDSHGKEVDFRVNVLPTALGEKIVLRVLDKNLDMLDVDKLGFEADSLIRLKECCHRPHGLILACGPTGSGKTTTLYSILKHIDSPGKNIITVEDPVEFQMKGLNQVNIRTEVGLTFPAALRSILRQDPDVILIGEIRDSDTLDIAVKAALTGHLVLSSLHTTTAAGSITRMINMGIEPFLICSSVIGIVAQRLVRRICSHCREAYTLPKEAIEEFHVDQLMPGHCMTFYRPKGCEKCFKSGYKGRVGITETLSLTAKIKELILSRASEMEIKACAREQGMKTMREDAVFKACRGLTSLEEVVRLTATD
ncbi:MAG: Flp pilus assembly complex ATPase component TadA [Candidatus Omnitrophica bacterium]|nr:Flp pilus assembly complex ATPase component TadA [Candidatus Omnitrophota bacterium]